MRLKRASIPLLILLSVVLVAALVIYFVNPSEKGSSVTSPKVILNEVMASNKGSVMDPNGNYSDCVELYNTTDADVDVSGCGLSDDKLSGVKWVIPSNTV